MIVSSLVWKVQIVSNRGRSNWHARGVFVCEAASLNFATKNRDYFLRELAQDYSQRGNKEMVNRNASQQIC